MSRICRKYPREVRIKAVALRRQGYSLEELMGLLQIRKATVQGWVHRVPLSKKAKERLRSRILAGGEKGRSRAIIACRQKMEIWRQEVQERSREFLKDVQLNPAIGKMLCSVLYLCEGSKYPSSRQLGFGNSDARLIRFFLYLLRSGFAVDEQKLRCQVLYRCDQSLEDLICYWSRVTRIPKEQFYSSRPDERTRGRPTLQKDYRGVCSVQYLDTTLQFTLQSIGETLMEKMVEPEGVEPSPSPCHGDTLPLRHGPKATQSKG